ncbi:hypothetical protein BaRGS_00011073 [Batillaria attramentaria]|uniref:Iodothyronine deiodinase n=1 Tax=Batillaria attramentaria TaxID=370345 RepID=A0ABD0LE32_9CAEN
MTAIAAITLGVMDSLNQTLRQLVFYFFYSVLISIKLLSYISPVARAMERAIQARCEDFNIGKIDWAGGLPVIASHLTQNVFKAVRKGREALDVDLYTLDGASVKLFDFMKKGRPLVVNFGSCS